MSHLRTFLQAQGLSARDIDEAVNEARKATRVIHFASGATVEVITRATSKVRSERVKAILAKGATVLQTVHDGTGKMLRRADARPREEVAPPPCAPSNGKKR